jgi:hypothetical protein
MNRNAFEHLLNSVLTEALESASEGNTAAAMRHFASTSYGRAEIDAAKSVAKLTGYYGHSRPLPVPSPEFLPPCF